MTSKKHYSLQIKNDVLEKIIYQHQKGQLVAKEFGIPYNTIMRWVRRERKILHNIEKKKVHNSTQILEYFSTLTEQIAAMRLELQLLTNKNQELVEILQGIIKQSDKIG